MSYQSGIWNRRDGVVAAYIGGAFWFTPTDFANPAVTLARALTDTFSGIRPSDVPGFLIAEIAGAVAAIVLCRWLVPNANEVTPAAQRIDIPIPGRK